MNLLVPGYPFGVDDTAHVSCPTCGDPWVHPDPHKIESRSEFEAYSSVRGPTVAVWMWCENRACPDFVFELAFHKGNTFIAVLVPEGASAS